MDKKELAGKLESVMDTVPVCEGLIYAELDGKVIIGQTLTEMDHDELAEKMASVLKADLSSAQKGDISDVSIEFSEGAIVSVIGSEYLVIGILGSDGLSSKGLLRRQLLNFMQER